MYVHFHRKDMCFFNIVEIDLLIFQVGFIADSFFLNLFVHFLKYKL